MKSKNDIMVTVCIVTYNQEKWIRQTLDSILAQDTEYPFEVIIGEDHGSDGTRAICQEYANKYENIVLLPETENMGVTANWIRCVQAGKGKYIMTCAGDDWWHNSKKIQMQVEFMEAHPECVVCHTDINEYNDNTAHTIRNVKHTQGIVPPEGMIQREILAGMEYISAVTMCIRRRTFEKYVPADEFARRRFPREDWPTLLVLAAHGEIRYIPESTATYRVGQESITRTANYEKIIKRTQKDREMTEYLYSLFPEWGEFKDSEYFDHIGYHQAMMAAYRNNDYQAAHKYAKMDIYPNKATYMAKTWLTFNIYRWLKRR
jgi:glycosyltransferase involved in cell wall biosynthesis